jgi:hypothetical protein
MGVSRCDLQGNIHVQLEWEQRIKSLHPRLRASGLSRPALRALWRIGVREPSDLSRFTEYQLLSEHGLGQAGMRILKETFSDILKP